MNTGQSIEGSYNLRRRRSSVAVTDESQTNLKYNIRKGPGKSLSVSTSKHSKKTGNSSPIKKHKVDEESKETIEPSEQATSTLDKEVSSILAALRRNMPKDLPGRETQLQELRETLVTCHDDKTSVSIYICGCPGTGKTITLRTLIALTDISRKYRPVFINCMGLNPPRRVYLEILKSFGVEKKKKPTFDTVSELVSKEKKSLLIILDEIDELGKQDPTVLYSLFGLISTYPSGKIALIGVGNTLNFVNKYLPFLRKKPVTLHFSSYNTQEIITIINKRLSKVDAKRLIFSEGAVRLLAAKVESMGGDARMALGLASTSVSNILDGVDRYSTDEVCTVGPQNVLSVWDSNFDTVGRFLKMKKSDSTRIIDSLPLHQKLIICSILLVLEKDKRPAALTFQKIQDMYKKICQKNQFEIIPPIMFMNSCSSIEDYGIILLKGKEVFSKVILKWDKDELARFFKKETMFGDIMSQNYQ